METFILLHLKFTVRKIWKNSLMCKLKFTCVVKIMPRLHSDFVNWNRVFANIKEHLEKGTNPKKFETEYESSSNECFQPKICNSIWTINSNFSLKWFQRIRDSLPPTPNIAHSVQSEEDFNERVKNAGSKVVLIDFHAKWCKPCHLLSPYIEQFAKKYESQLLVLKVDVDDETELALHRYRASKLPTFVYLKNGAEVERYFGTDYRHIESVIKKFI